MSKATRSRLAMALGVLIAVAGVVCWFIGIWTHGHDAASRWSGTGFLAVLVGGCLCLTGAVMRA